MPCGICGLPGHNRRTCGAGSSSTSFSSYRSSSSSYSDFDSYEAPRYTQSYRGSGRNYEDDNSLDSISGLMGGLGINDKSSNQKSRSSTAKARSPNIKWTSEAQQRFKEGIYNFLQGHDQYVHKTEPCYGMLCNCLVSNVTGPTDKDSPGNVYVYKEKGKDNGHFKVGKAKDPDRRIRDQERANDTEYEVVAKHRTACAGLAETMIHKHLAEGRAPKSKGDGRTEWFKGDETAIKETAKKAAARVNRNEEYVRHCNWNGN